MANNRASIGALNNKVININTEIKGYSKQIFELNKQIRCIELKKERRMLDLYTAVRIHEKAIKDNKKHNNLRSQAHTLSIGKSISG